MSKYTEKTALEAAMAAKVKMRKPQNWRVEVWGPEWHWSLTSNNVTLYESGADDDEFFALISETIEDVPAGVAEWDSVEDYSTDPQEAVDMALRSAAEYVGKLRRAVKLAEQAAGIEVL